MNATDSQDQVQAEINFRNLCGLAWKIHEGADVSPESIGEVLADCGHDQQELDEIVSALNQRGELLESIANEPQLKTRQQEAEQLQQARDNLEKAKAQLAEIEPGYLDRVRAIQAQVNRIYDSQKTIKAIEIKYPKPE